MCVETNKRFIIIIIIIPNTVLSLRLELHQLLLLPALDVRQQGDSVDYASCSFCSTLFRGDLSTTCSQVVLTISSSMNCVFHRRSTGSICSSRVLSGPVGKATFPW